MVSPDSRPLKKIHPDVAEEAAQTYSSNEFILC
jgi:hypothetical protein